mmetsp:Transcript_20149/g.57170  ORF Transcript_20149/g.57170 Transcript_20149/m.57170 type:complete len:268 (-) Transcript_20149:717-1520(-)
MPRTTTITTPTEHPEVRRAGLHRDDRVTAKISSSNSKETRTIPSFRQSSSSTPCQDTRTVCWPSPKSSWNTTTEDTTSWERPSSTPLPTCKSSSSTSSRPRTWRVPRLRRRVGSRKSRISGSRLPTWAAATSSPVPPSFRTRPILPAAAGPRVMTNSSTRTSRIVSPRSSAMASPCAIKASTWSASSSTRRPANRHPPCCPSTAITVHVCSSASPVPRACRRTVPAPSSAMPWTTSCAPACGPARCRSPIHPNAPTLCCPNRRDIRP